MNEDLIPAVQDWDLHLPVRFRAELPTAEPEPELRPMVATQGGDVLAGTYERSPSSGGIVLPLTSRPERWIPGAFRYWSQRYGRFPIVGGWRSSPTWMTAEQEREAEDLKAAEDELDSQTRMLRERIDLVTTRLEEAGTRASLGPLRLLEDKGDSLKDAVADALRTIGFDVVDRDDDGEPADGGGKAEDLGASDPEVPDWDPVIEVKGYDGGAKGSDIRKLQRHVRRAERAGRTPDAAWWVINHNRNKDPDERGLVLRGEDAMVDDEASGEPPLLIVDTRDLFVAAKAVEVGKLDPRDVRASLRRSTGRWDGMGLRES